MSSSKIVETVELSPKGRAISSDGKYHVVGALPQEKCLIEVGPRKKKTRVGFLRDLISTSPNRIPPKCSHFPYCGGCSIQQMDYAAQLQHKEKTIHTLFESLPAKQTEIRPIIGCQNPWEYRNKMEFSFSQNANGEKFLGLMLAGSKGRVLNLNECHLVSKWFISALKEVREWWVQSNLQAYRHHRDSGHLRTLTLRESKQGRGKMAILTVSGNPEFAINRVHIKGFIDALKKVTQETHLSIFLQVHQICKGKPTQFYEMVLDGPDHITEKLHIEIDQKIHTLEFKISPTSFFQPNTVQAQKFYSIGLNMLTLKNASIFDLYCGSGTLGLSAAIKAKEVIGIELNPHAVFDAQWNQETNGIKNFSVFKGDVGKVLAEKNFTPPDIIIIDPPRTGIDAKTLEHLKQLNPKEILYISCNPQTQAANIAELSKSGYKLEIIQPVDQFPHTIHVENICLLKK